MKYCSKCGTALNDDAAYCVRCGAKTGDAEPEGTKHIVAENPFLTEYKNVKPKIRKGLMFIAVLCGVIAVIYLILGVFFVQEYACCRCYSWHIFLNLWSFIQLS